MPLDTDTAAAPAVLATLALTSLFGRPALMTAGDATGRNRLFPLLGSVHRDWVTAAQSSAFTPMTVHTDGSVWVGDWWVGFIDFTVSIDWCDARVAPLWPDPVEVSGRD